MSLKGPIILIEDDLDDQEIVRDILQELNIRNPVKSFTNGKDAFEYLKVTTDSPFVILSDLNMPVMSGLELRKQMNDDVQIRQKSIPFVFFTTSASKMSITDAYHMSVQGFFEKGNNMQEIATRLKIIYDYWQLCRHPNN